jgi:maltooligosyltrehalose trehalohydrolase
VTHRFEVWAPIPERTDLVLEQGTVSMTPDGSGWWRADVDDAGPGTRYGFSLDGGPTRPDPRSRSQPGGVDGWSEVVDLSSFEWSAEGWRGLPLRGAVLYELHVGTFTPDGTFDAAIEQLPHLVDLGVDAVELLPVAEFPGRRGWGYDGVDLFAPHHAYGGPVGLARLVDACHAHGLGVVLDVVYNHLGPAGNHLPEFGPYFSDRHHTNWGPAINFDGPGSDEVRRFVIDNALMWLREYRMDGLRLDAVHAIVDDSACHLLEELATEVDAVAARLGRPVFLIAESDLNDPRFVRSRDAGGHGLDAAWADEWHHALHSVLTGERGGYYEDFGSFELLAKALRQAWVYDGTWSPHRRRHHGRSPIGLVGHQFVVCAQNHDQIGNRAVGDRLGALVGEGRLRVAAALLLTSPFTPMLFQGEEWGAATPFQYFTDHPDPDLGRAVSEGRRGEFSHFGWSADDVPDPQDAATFDRSRLDWSERDREPHAGLLDWYRRLITLRREHPELADPRLDRVDVVFDEERRWLVVSRGTSAIQGTVQVLVNLGEHEHEFPMPAVGGLPVVLAGSHDAVRVELGSVTVPPDAVAIVELADP